MGLQKQTQNFSFGQGLSLKDDVNRIPVGKFLSLNNSVFDTLGQLKKRNGFGSLTSTIGSVSYVTTYENNLIGLGNSIQSYSGAINQFINKGSFPNVRLAVSPISNALYGYTQVDSAISNNGLVCVVSSQIGPAPFVLASTPFVFNYSIIEQATGQLISGPTNIVSSGGIQQYSPKVFAVGSNFVVMFDAQVVTPATSNSTSWLNYITIPTSAPFTSGSVFQISSNCLLTSGQRFDAVVTSTSGLFVSWTGQQTNIYATNLNPVNKTTSPQLVLFSNFKLGVSIGTPVSLLAVAADYTTTPFTMWTGIGGHAGICSGSVAYISSSPLGSLIASSPFISCSGSFAMSSTSQYVANLTMTAQNGSMTAYVELSNSYPYDDTIKTNIMYTQQAAATTCSGNYAISSTTVPIARGLGLASKGFIINSSSYALGQWLSPYQSTYFLINSTGQVQTTFAYGNANNNPRPLLSGFVNNDAYFQNGLPTASVVGSSAYVPYLIQNTISPVGKQTNVSSQTGIFGKLGINIAQVNFSSQQVPPTEIGENLLLGGGFLGSYDGQQFTENDFFLFPDSVEVTTSTTSGTIAADTYSYIAIYEWADNKGNIFRSAESLPISITTTGTTSANTIKVPTLRISYKNYPYGGMNTPAKISLYRWSIAQPLYYFVANFVQDTTVTIIDSVTFIDTYTNNTILGNQILYTNGGVVDDSGGPATKAMTTFDSRLWLIDGEDQNLLWFSKQVIENTPVEMSQLFTFYVAPSVGAEGPTGVMNCLAPMDDRLIIFKESAIYYINGVGPDNTGAQNQYSQPIFVTSGVGCSNQNSIVLIPNGLMFQSNKGIWLLGRDLSTNYIGKDVEAIANANVVQSAITIPGTNQVRFTMNTGITLLYDYFVNEWGTFSGQPGISSCLYNNLHTYVSASSSLYQETPGVFLDGLSPVLMSFTTGWIGLSGLQGYQRAYAAYLLGTYYTPHNFTMSIGYDYNSAIKQVITVNPTNTTGSGSQVEQWELNFIQQSCQSFQLTFNEIASQSAGQGLTISGLDLVYGQKKGFPQDINKRNSTS